MTETLGFSDFIFTSHVDNLCKTFEKVFRQPSTNFSSIILMLFYFYVLENEKNELYFGCTNDLKRRIKEHNSGKSRSTKNNLWQLIYYEAYASEADAYRRESKIKDHGQAKRHLKERIKNCRRGDS